MLLRISYTTLLTIASVASTDSLLSPSLVQRQPTSLHVGGGAEDDGFVDALSGSSNNSDEGEEKETGDGGNRFKAMMEAAKERTGGSEPMQSTSAVENPFLNPTPAPSPQLPDPDNLSVEDQARLFRAMMQQQQASPAPPAPPAPQRTAKTNKAGRPVGRNRDADQIANAADVYFAQLKRDSTVRTLARYREDDDIADNVFGDDGIKELEGLLQKNPHLQGQREQEMALIDTVPEEVIAPYVLGAEKSDQEDVTSSGISYKEKLKQIRAKQAAKGSPPSQSTPENQNEGTALEAPAAQTVTQQPEQQETEPVQPSTPPSQPITAADVDAQVVSPSNPAEVRQKIRTLMGMLLKHRGGPGFGSGRLKGPEIDRFEGLTREVEQMLRAEAMESVPRDVPMVTAPVVQETAPPPTIEETISTPADPVVTQAQAAMSPTNPPTSTASAANVDSAVACIDGALTMYKNMPAELRGSVLVTLQAALMSAVNTINSAIGSSPNPPAAMASVDSAVTCIEGALTMYKNSPAELRDSVLVTMQAALMSAVNTIDSTTGSNEAVTIPTTQSTPPQPAASPAPVPETPVQPSTPVVAEKTTGTDPNSKILDKIYNSMKAAAGDGNLGLRSDLSPAEASELTDQLSEMRGILMEELDAGIPDPGSDRSTVAKKQSPVASGGSSASNYKEMLAKARAEKAAAASA